MLIDPNAARVQTTGSTPLAPRVPVEKVEVGPVDAVAPGIALDATATGSARPPAEEPRGVSAMQTALPASGRPAVDAAAQALTDGVTRSLLPGGPAFAPSGIPRADEAGGPPFLLGGPMGGMLGAMIGGSLDAAQTEAAVARMQKMGDAFGRLQALEGGYTAAHMQRAGFLAAKLADALEGTPRALSMDQRFALGHASMIYDVGKLEVDEALLLKPGKLTDEERQAVNRHVQPSEDLLSLFNPSPETRGIIRHHHERWDGKGFPDALLGDATPLTARMVAITDSWDAMTCDRPFRPAMPYEKARSIIESGAGTQYDPDLVKAFFEKVAPRL